VVGSGEPNRGVEGSGGGQGREPAGREREPSAGRKLIITEGGIL